MSEDAGKDIGSRLGKVLKVAKRSLQAEQAKFMQIRVEIPIDKPLRRGGNITNAEGERSSIIFRYECLPTFCYICGILGHDDKHCTLSQMEALKERQYGDLLRAGGVVRSGSEKGKGFEGGSPNCVDGDRTSFRSRSTVANGSSSSLSKDGVDDGQNSNNGLAVKMAANSETLTRDSNSNLMVSDNLNGWDKIEEAARGWMFCQEIRSEENETRSNLAKESVRPNEDAMSAAVFKTVGPSCEEPEVSSPIKSKKEALKIYQLNEMGLASEVEKEKETISKGRWKKMAREKGKAQDEEMVFKGPEVGNKRTESIEELLEVEGRVQKKLRGEVCNNKISDFIDETAVTARQHYREK